MYHKKEMDTIRLYKIIFEGKIQDGQPIEFVRANLANLFKVSPAVIDRIFNESPTTIQRNLSEEKALRYKEMVEQSGALCRMESETPSIHVNSPPPPPPEPPVASPSPPPPAAPPAAQIYNPAPTPPEPPSTTEAEVPVSGPQRIEREAWKALVSGLIIAAVTLSLPFLSFIFRYLITLVHEIGHAVFGWLYGYPSVPAFDFTYGGGVTIHQDRKIVIVIIVYLLFAALLYLYRRNVLSLVIIISAAALYTLTAFTSLHSIIILFMGHGTELIFGGLFMYRAISGSGVLVAVERPLYAFLGFFVFFNDMQFAHRLVTSPFHQAQYEAAKGGGHWMDFSRIAEEYLHLKLSTVAAFFLLLCFIAPLLGYLFFRYKNTLFKTFSRILNPYPA
jgi:hypothetical protein